MSQFTELEERFIEANIPVLRATARQLEAAAEFRTAEEAGLEVAEALGREEHPGIDRMRALVLEAAERAGYARDGEVVAEIERSFVAAQAIMDLIAAAGDSVIEGLTANSPAL